MKNKQILIFLISVLTSISTIGQVKLNWKLDIIPGKTVSSATYDFVRSYAADGDNNLIFCCTKGTYHSKGFTLMKLNKNGLVEWQKNYLSNDSVNIDGMMGVPFLNDSLLMTDDQGNIYLSFQNVSSNQYQNLKLDKNGNQLWLINLTRRPTECRINSKNELILNPSSASTFPTIMKVDTFGIVTEYVDSSYWLPGYYGGLWIDDDDSIHFIDIFNETGFKWNLNSQNASNHYINLLTSNDISGTVDTKLDRYLFSNVNGGSSFFTHYDKNYTQDWTLSTVQDANYNSAHLAPDGSLYFQSKEVDTLRVYKIDTTGVLSVMFSNPFLVDPWYIPTYTTSWEYYMNYHPGSKTFISGSFYETNVSHPTISCFAFDSVGNFLNHLKVPLASYEQIESNDMDHITYINHSDGYTFVGRVNSDSGFVALGFTVGEPSNVSGRLFIDANNNCTWDSTETVLGNHLVYATGTNFATVSDTNGIYEFTLPAGNYSLQVSNPTMFTNGCGINYNINITTGTLINNLEFPLNYDSSYVDLGTTIYAHNAVSVNPNYDFTVHVFNNGVIPQTGNLSVIIDSIFNYSSAIPSPSQVNGNVLTWNNISIAGGLNQILQISCTHSTNISAGTPFNILSTFLPVTGTDVQPYDNSDIVTRHFQASLDPNEKFVSPDGIIHQNDSVLHYQIQFQNTGNFEAFNVTIIDSLDINLDLSTLHLGFASHDYNYSIVNGNVLKIEFPQIMLPDSGSNEPASHGEINYYISPKKNLSNGIQILNTAHIYFDFNTPVNTNSTINILIFTGINEQESKTFSVFPNPANDNVVIRFNELQKENKQIRILDLTGREIVNQELECGSKSEISINIKSFVAGVYFLNIENITVEIVKF